MNPIMTNSVRSHGAIVTDRKSVSFSYRSPIGMRKVTITHASIARSANRAYARVVNGKK